MHAFDIENLFTLPLTALKLSLLRGVKKHTHTPPDDASVSSVKWSCKQCSGAGSYSLRGGGFITALVEPSPGAGAVTTQPHYSAAQQYFNVRRVDMPLKLLPML